MTAPRRIELGALDLSGIVREGDTVLWGQACAEPLSLTEALMAQRRRIGRFRVFLGTAFSETLQADQADVITFSGFAGTGACRRLAKAGALDVVPAHMTAIDQAIRAGRMRVDVVLVQTSRASERGEYSLGLASDYVRPAIDRARVVVAEASDRVPFTTCQEPLRAEDIDVVVETSRAPVEVPAAAFGEVERRIAANVAAYVPERATLQIGLGAVPDAVLAGLAGHRGLGIHSAIVGDRVADLVDSGAITNEHKSVDPGVSVACLLIGTRRVYDFADRNPRLLMAPVTRTHAFAVASRLRRFVALNSAVEVDLTGAVNAETIDGEYVGLVGGQVDFMRAAAASKDGVAIVALPSTAKAGARSRIVARLSGPVTTARSDAGVVVTEHGAADLRGASLRERVRRMLAIADPVYRDALERDSGGLVC